MNETIPIQGRGNFPTLQIKLVGLVVLVKSKLEAAGIIVHDVRLNGSVASSVLAVESNIEYNDLDLIFSIELDSPKQYEIVKKVVLDSLLDLLPEGTSKERMSGITLKEAYVSKMVKVTETDRWSLIGLGNNHTKSVELKFVDTMKRKYEFSVDSFHIILDTLFLFYECSKMCMSENFYPTVVGESVYGDFSEALYHLENRLIATKQPEQIRGGGLLKYCNLLVKNYRPAVPEQVKNMERYMCSRFFIDFPDLTQQRTKLVKFLDNHFLGPDVQLKYDYLNILYQVVDESTVCLMGHERRQTLQLIEALSCNVFLPTNNNNSYESTTISNWCNGGGGVMNGDLSMSSQSSSSGVALSNSSSSSCHSSRSSPAPQGSYTVSSPGSSSSYPSPAPSSASSNGGGVTVCNYAPPQCHAVVSTSYQSHFTTSPPNYHHKKKHGINNNKNKNKNGNNNINNGGQYSPMSASSGGSPQSLSPKPVAVTTTVPVNHCGEEWRLVPISWVTLSPAPTPNHQQPPPPVTSQPPKSESSLTSNQTATYRQVAVRSINTLDNSNGGVTCQQPPCVTLAAPTTCNMVGTPPSQPPPPPSATVIQTSPPPNHHTVAVTSQNSGTPHLATYEIITTCPPQMLYSNGNYYTAFLKTVVAAGGPTLVASCCTGNGEMGTAVNVTAATPTIMTAQPCYSCSCTCQAASMWTLPPASHQTT